MFSLNNVARLSKKRKRVGRGGSRGGTSGRGHKGQRARSGGKRQCGAFEGGQMPLVRRLPKRGFNNAEFAVPTEIINISGLESAFEAGATITAQELIMRGLVKGHHIPRIKLLGNGIVTKSFTVYVNAASKGAIEAIVKAGGEVRIQENQG